MAVCLLSECELLEARTPEDIADVRRLFRAYADWLEVDLCFQGFERELAELPGCYAPPAGRLLIARVGGEVVGCVGLRPLEASVCEMKRLWVEPGFAGYGVGRASLKRSSPRPAISAIGACASTPFPRACRRPSISTPRSAFSRSPPITTIRSPGWSCWNSNFSQLRRGRDQRSAAAICASRRSSARPAGS